MLDAFLLDLIACPECGTPGLGFEGPATGDERTASGTLCCAACGTRFPVANGIPDLVPHRLLDGPAWGRWQQHLEGLTARRQAREHGRFISGLGRHDINMRAFSAFLELSDGVLLDVGCGTGRLRNHLPPACRYIGVDPLPLPGVEGFPFCRAVAERLPFRDNAFDHVAAVATLDHVNDLDHALREIARVLRPGGRFHVLQSLHEVRGPASVLRWLAHALKDRLEEHISSALIPDVPKHMAEFTDVSLHTALAKSFRVTAERRFGAHWYYPRLLFATLRVAAEATREPGP